MPTLLELIKRSGPNAFIAVLQREVYYPKTDSIEDATTATVDFTNFATLAEDAKYTMHLKARGTREDVNTILAALGENKSDFLTHRADKLLVKMGGFTEVVLENSLRPNTGVSIAVNSIAVKRELEQRIQIDAANRYANWIALGIMGFVFGSAALLYAKSR